jgi:hypothetical protein
MTPVEIVGAAAPVLTSQSATVPNGVSGREQAEVFLVSGPDRSDGLVVAQASPGDAVPETTADGPAVNIGSARRSDPIGRGGTVGESVLRYMETLHESGRRIRERAPAVPEPAVRLVTAAEPGPAAAVLAPPGQPSPQRTGDDRFEATLKAMQQLNDYTIAVGLAANTVRAANKTIESLTSMS